MEIKKVKVNSMSLKVENTDETRKYDVTANVFVNNGVVTNFEQGAISLKGSLVQLASFGHYGSMNVNFTSTDAKKDELVVEIENFIEAVKQTKFEAE